MASNEPIWHPGALADAEEARNWYAERSPKAARGFLFALDEGVDAVMGAPERWPQHRHGSRRYVFPSQYPYSLIYRFRKTVEIVAVAHQKRRPDYWKHR